MAQQNWWEQDQIVAPAQQAAPPQTSGGDPIVKRAPTVDPLDAAIKGITIQKGQADLADRNKPALPAGYRWKNGIVGGDAEPIPGIPQKDSAGGDVLAKQQEQWRAMMLGAGVDLEKGVDPVAPLIEGSTSGMVQRIGADIVGAVTGSSTSGMENIQRLRTLANDMVLQLSGGSLGAQISNSDRDFMAARLGDIANPDLPYDQRLGAWDQVKQRAANLMGIQIPASNATATASGAPSAANTWSKEQSIAHWGEELYDQDGNPLGPDGGPSFDAQGTPKGFAAEINTGPSTSENRQEQVNQIASERDNMGGYVDATVRGAADTLSLGLADKLSALLSTINSSKSYQELLDRERMTNEADSQNSYARQVGQFGGALAFPARGVATLGRSALGGAGFGGAYAFNTSDEPFTQRGDNALLGAALGAGGGALGFGVAKGAGATYNALRGRSPVVQEVAENADIIAAGQRQGIPIRQPDARPSTRADFAAAEASAAGNAPITRALDADRQAVQSRVSEIGGAGQVRDNFQVGETVQNAGSRYIAKTRRQANALYTRAQGLAGNVSVPPTKAVAAIDRNIAELTDIGANTNAGTIRYLNELKADLSSGAMTIDKLRSLRTNMRGQINERNLTQTDAERRVMDILGEASSDIDDALSSNPAAQGAYRNADAFYRERQDFIKQVVQKFTGPRNQPISAEQAASRLNSMMKEGGDSERFIRLWKELEPEERTDIQATFAEALGRDRNDNFSLSALAKNIRTINPRTAREVFGRDGMEAIKDLRVIAEAKTATARGLNSSRTAAVNARQNGFKDILLGAVGGGVGGVPGAIGGMAARGAIEGFSARRSARLLLNPDFTKWLRQTPNSSSPTVINRHFERLNKIAQKYPAINGDARALQQHLLESFASPSGMKAAAGEEMNNGRPEPEQ